ncbi:MAG: AAA family ATPase [Limnochordia bacterium]|nr:MAG: ATPase [Peptococcaceae bacterium 1109]
MKKYLLEILLGAGAAGLVLGLLAGLDLTPLLIGAAFAALIKLVVDGRAPLGRRFEAMGGVGGSAGSLPQITFADVGGQEAAKRELMEALAFLKSDSLSKKLGIRPLKGILLVGPPGTGKTLMAKAAANYTDSAFISASGSQFVEMYAGVGAQRIRRLFKQAEALAQQQKKGSCVVFVDEIDVLGAKRGSHQGHMEYDQTLNEFLVQLDGIDSEREIKTLVVAATNRADILDPALLRPGRFDRIVRVDLPDKAGRLRILEIHAQGRPLAPEVDLEKAAQETYGFSGAHLENVLNEAAINALRRSSEVITPADIREAIEKVMLGEKLDRTPTSAERRRIAYHEAGHAVIAEQNRPGAVSSITITSRGNALGYIRQSPTADQYLQTQDELVAAIQVCVAGAVSEELFLGQRSTGAVGDIRQATEIAKQMVYAGLSPLGIVGAELPTNLLHDAVTDIIRRQEQIVRGCLEEHGRKVQAVAEHLLQHDSISGDQFRGFLAQLAS